MKYTGLKTAVIGAGILGLMTSVTFAETTISFLVDNGPTTVKIAEALSAAYESKNSNIKIEVELRPGGGDGDNLVKTRLATGEMADVFRYNSGSLFHALHPEQTLVDLSNEALAGNVIDSYKQVVSAGGKLYGVPLGSAMGGGIFYHIPTYEKLGLSIPTTWAEFMSNNAAIAESGAVPVGQTYGDSWTSQLFVLADYYNVQAEVPNFAVDYTNNKAKFAATPAALRGFEKLEEVFEAGYLNEDFGAASYQDGLKMIANGEVAHYPMLTFAIGTLSKEYSEQIQDVGFFAQPGDNAASNGLTTWMPDGVYIPKSSDNIEEAKKFVNYLATVEACDVQTKAVGASGPYLISGCTIPDTVPTAVSDMVKYFEKENGTAPALEFLSPIKGPALEQITVEVGSGIRKAADGAELYDRDVKKQAQQLGLANW